MAGKKKTNQNTQNVDNKTSGGLDNDMSGNNMNADQGFKKDQGNFSGNVDNMGKPSLDNDRDIGGSNVSSSDMDDSAGQLNDDTGNIDKGRSGNKNADV